MSTTKLPRTLTGDLADPPKALAPLCLMPNWVAWRWQRSRDGEKWTKPPFRAGDPNVHAANNDPSTWDTRSAAVAAVVGGKADGVGFVLTGTEIGAIDLDKCRDPKTGKIDRWAMKILKAARGSYVEVTVSGEGFRIVGIATGPHVHRRFPVAGRDGAGIEIYRRATRYITVSGVEIDHCAELPNIDHLIDNLVVQYDGASLKLPDSNSPSAGGNGADDIDGLIERGAPKSQRSEAFARVVWSLAGQGLSQQEIEETLKKHPDGIAQKYIKRLSAEVERCYRKWEQQQSGASTSSSPSSSSWDDPDTSILDDRRGDLPDFPLDVFSVDWQAWLANAAHGAGTTVDHVVVPLLAVASSLIGTARLIKPSKSWPEPFTMWTAVVGYSGTGKTPGLDVTKRALTKIERDRRARIGELRRVHESKAEQARAAHKAWKAAVQAAVEDNKPAPPMPADADIPADFIEPRLYVSNSTVEKIAVLLKARPRGMLMIIDELAALFLNLARYSGGTDREFWIEAWNGKYYVVERMSRETVAINHLLVGMTGGFQPDKLNRSFGADADGIHTRMLFAWPTEPKFQKLTDDVDEVEPEFYNTLTRLIDLPAEQNGEFLISLIGLTNDARNDFEDFRKYVHDEKKSL